MQREGKKDEGNSILYIGWVDSVFLNESGNNGWIMKKIFKVALRYITAGGALKSANEDESRRDESAFTF